MLFQEETDGSEDYSNPDYWDERYVKTSSHCEWYGDYITMKTVPCFCDLLDVYRARGGVTALEVGCGNSVLALQLVADGVCSRVTAVDFSATVVEQMQAKFGMAGSLVRFEQADVCRLPYANGSFAAIFDKGCLDAVSCVPGGQRAKVLALAVSEIRRVLRDDGRFVLVSHSRDRHLMVERFFVVESTGTFLDTEADEPLQTIIYILRKKDDKDIAPLAEEPTAPTPPVDADGAKNEDGGAGGGGVETSEEKAEDAPLIENAFRSSKKLISNNNFFNPDQ